MTRIYRSRYSAVRIEGISISTETFECSLQEHTPPHRPPRIVPRLEVHARNDDHGEWGKPTIEPGSET